MFAIRGRMIIAFPVPNNCVGTFVCVLRMYIDVDVRSCTVCYSHMCYCVFVYIILFFVVEGDNC